MKKRYQHLAATFGWISVFPGFILYQTLVQHGTITHTLGGGFTFATIVSLIALTPSLALRAANKLIASRRSSAATSLLPSLLYWAYILIFTLSVLLGVLDGIDEDITSPLLAYAFKFVALYLVITSLPLSASWFSPLNRAILVALSALIIANSPDGVFMGSLANTTSAEIQLDYQGIGLAYAVVALAGIYSIPKYFSRWLYWLLAGACLYLIGARSEFVGFLFAAAIIELTAVRTMAHIIALLCLAIVSITLLLSAVFSLTQTDSRMLSLLSLSNDPSAIERSALTTATFAVINENPLLGSFASYTPGNYSHNILSAWADLGLPGLLSLVALIALPALAPIICSTIKRHPIFPLSLGLAVMCLTLVLFAKTYFYPLIPISFAVFVYMTRNQTDQNGPNLRSSPHA